MLLWCILITALLTSAGMAGQASPVIVIDNLEGEGLDGWSHKDNVQIEGEAPAEGEGALHLRATFADVSYGWSYYRLDEVRDFSNCAGISMRVRGDGSEHRLHAVLKCGPHGEKQFVSDEAISLRSGQWRRSFLPFSAFEGLRRSELRGTGVVGIVMFQSGAASGGEVWVDDYLFLKRPGVYVTVHWGRPQTKQGKEVGAVWMVSASIGDDATLTYRCSTSGQNDGEQN